MIKRILSRIIRELNVVPFHYHCSRCLSPVNFSCDGSIYDKNQQVVCENCIRKIGIKTLKK